MKKNILAILAAFSALSNSFAVNAYDYRIMEQNAANTGVITQWIPVPPGGANGMFVLEGNASGYPTPHCAEFGTGLNYNPLTGIVSVSGFATVATTGAYSDLSGLPTLGSAAAQGTGAFDASGSAAAAQAFSIQRANHTGTQAQSTVVNLVSDLAAKEPSISAGTTAQYWRGDKTWQTLPSAGVGTVTSVGLTSSNLTVTGSPITTSGNLTVALPSVGSASTYSGVTTDAQGRVTAGSVRAFTNNASKTLVTSSAGQGGVVLDASRDVLANYSVSTSTTATIGGASTVTVFLEIASTNSATAGDWTTIAKTSNGQNITLAIALQSVQTNILNFGAIVPAGQYVRIRYATTGTGSATYDSGQEVKL